MLTTHLGFSPKKTMMIAQNYMKAFKLIVDFHGVITYMRTDSLNIAKEAIAIAEKHIKNNYDEKYLPSKANIYTTKAKGAQEAHEAIRPTNTVCASNCENTLIKIVKTLLLYTINTLSQMTPAIFENATVIISSKKAEFKLSGRKLAFDGFYKSWRFR